MCPNVNTQALKLLLNRREEFVLHGQSMFHYLVKNIASLSSADIRREKQDAFLEIIDTLLTVGANPPLWNYDCKLANELCANIEGMEKIHYILSPIPFRRSIPSLPPLHHFLLFLWLIFIVVFEVMIFVLQGASLNVNTLMKLRVHITCESLSCFWLDDIATHLA